MRKQSICAAVLLLGALTSATAQTRPSDEFEALRLQVQRLTQEVESLKRVAALPVPGSVAAEPSAAQGIRIDKLELASQQAVVAGDLPGSFKLAGSGTSVRLYGIAEVHGIYDLRAPGPNDLFTDLGSQPLNNAGVQKGRTSLTAETSRLGIDTSTPMGVHTLSTKLEVDFYAYRADGRNRMRLRQAYGEYGNWLVGQTWSTFMDLDNLPETVDFNGPIGAPFSRRAMVRYTYGNEKAGYKFSVAAEDPTDQFAGGSANARLPQLVARYDQTLPWGAFNARLLSHEKRSATQTKRGFGVAFGGRYKLSDKDTLMAQYTRVDGDIDQLYGSNGYSIAGDGTITFDKNQGVVAGYSRTISDAWRATVAYGVNRGQSAQALNNRQLQQLFLNTIYSPLKNVEIGIEYIYGQRKTFTGDTGTMSRFDLMGRFSF